MPSIKRQPFRPERIAYFEANGWRAYYERRWWRLLRLVVGINQEQFNIPFPRSWLAAYYVVRASVAWVPLDHDERKVKYFYEKFYCLAQKYSGLNYDPALVAALELEYNDVHRRLVHQPDKAAFVDTMTRLHAAVFGLSLQEARPSAELRVLANNTVDLISNKISSDHAADWQRLEEYLRQCYASIGKVLAERPSVAAPSSRAR